MMEHTARARRSGRITGTLITIALLLTLVTAMPASAAVSLYLPYPAGTTYTVTQGNNGATSHHTQYGRYAVDFGVPKDSSVVAAAAGTILRAKGGCSAYTANKSCNGGLGNYMDVKHSDGRCSRYAHLASFKVSQGASVARGQRIALSGNSGWSTGPHLDFRVTRCDSTSIPFKFVEYTGSYDDSVIFGKRLTSKNTAPTTRPTRTDDEPDKYGPSQYYQRRSGADRTYGWDNDSWTTYSIQSSRTADVNYAVWRFGDVVSGKHAVEVFVPKRYGYASTSYRVKIGSSWVLTKAITQGSYSDQWVRLGTVSVPGGRPDVAVRVGDRSSSPYKTQIVWDAVRLRPV